MAINIILCTLVGLTAGMIAVAILDGKTLQAVKSCVFEINRKMIHQNLVKKDEIQLTVSKAYDIADNIVERVRKRQMWEITEGAVLFVGGKEYVVIRLEVTDGIYETPTVKIEGRGTWKKQSWTS